jgi:hypothetical protein
MRRARPNAMSCSNGVVICKVARNTDPKRHEMSLCDVLGSRFPVSIFVLPSIIVADIP